MRSAIHSASLSVVKHTIQRVESKYFLHQELSLVEQSKSIKETFVAPTNLGNARAEIVGDFLEQHLPDRLRTKRGTVVDAAKRSTGEIDLVVADHESGTLTIGGESMVFAEAAVACIEVKSTLTKRHLRLAAEKIARVKSLERAPETGIWASNSEEAKLCKVKMPPPAPMGVIIAFDGPRWQTIGGSLVGNPDWYANDWFGRGPDLVIVLGKGLLVKNDHHLHGFPPDKPDLVLERYRSGLRMLVADIMVDRFRYGQLAYDIVEYFNEGAVELDGHPWPDLPPPGVVC